MKVLMFLDYYNVGGIEKVIMNIKENIDNHYHIDILSMVNKSNDDVISLLDKDYRKLFLRSLFGLSKYKKYLRNNKYDIIHIHCYNSFGLIYCKIAYKYCDRVILHAHNSDIDKDFLHIKHIINGIIKLLFRSNRYTYIAVSNDANKFCFNRDNCLIIHNGIDYKKYLFNEKDRIKYRKKFNYKEKDIIIGHIGRFESQKNHEFIIDIFNEISKIDNNYKLILVGEGTLLVKIKEKVNKLGINSKIIFFNNRDDIPNFINMFDIFLFPSIYEGFPLSLIENQINGKYVFASDSITKDTKISNRIKYISLDKDAKYWAHQILHREKIDVKIDNKLNINYFVEKIEELYHNN